MKKEIAPEALDHLLLELSMVCTSLYIDFNQGLIDRRDFKAIIYRR